MPSLLTLLAPLAGAALIGAFVAARRIFGQAEARILSRFVFMVAMPIAVFNFAVHSSPPTPAYMGMVVGYLVGLFLVTGLCVLIAQKIFGFSLREAGAIVMTVNCGNAVFLGLPIALQIPDWGPPFLMLMIFEGGLAYAIAISLATSPEHETPSHFVSNIARASLRALTNPIPLALIIGTAIVILGIQLPDVIDAPLRLFSGIAAPMGLFVLGLYLVILPRESRDIPVKLVAIMLPLKLVVFPAVAAAICWVLTKDVLLTSVVGFFTILPPAVSSIVLAATYELKEREVATLTAIGSLLGLVIIALYLAAVLPSAPIVR